MSIAYGRNRTIGIKEETSFGTKETSGFSFVELTTEKLQKNIPHIDGTGIRGNASFIRRQQVLINVSGSIGDNELFPEGGFPIILKGVMGSVGSALQGGSAYKHTYSLIDDIVYGITKGFTIKVNRDIGTILDFYGCVFNQLSIKSTSGGAVMWNAEVLGVNQDTGDSASATYVTPNPFLHTQVQFTLASETYQISDWSVTINNNLDGNFYGAGNTRVKIPRNGRREITGTITKPVTEDTDVAAIYNKFIANTPATLDITFTGAVISAPYSYVLNLNMPVIVFNGPPDFASGGIENPNLAIPFKAYGTSGADEISAYIISTETSI